jgi:hypothetical protein
VRVWVAVADAEPVGVVRLSVRTAVSAGWDGMGCGGAEQGTRGAPRDQARGPGRVRPRAR